MHPITHQPISRRTLLRGSGVALALPMLEAMMPSLAFGRPSKYQPAASSVAAHPRMICCYVPQGVNEQQWYPNNDGRGLTITPTLEPLKEFQSDFTLISGLGHPKNIGSHQGADVWLTGADLDATAGKDYQNSVSVDQVAAAKHGTETRLPSLELSSFSGTGTAEHSNTLSFDRNGTPLPAENHPRRLFERLFVPSDATSKKETQRRYAKRKSILDVIRGDARRLHATLGASDQRKLNEYLDSVRETERRTERPEAWVDVPPPQVNTDGLNLNAQPKVDHDREMWLDVMMELAYLALQTDTTRVITFEWDSEPGRFGDGGENHHELSHHGGDPGKLRGLAKIDRFYVTRIARFISFLKRTKEADGNMLDRTMVLYGSGESNGKFGGHSPKNVPLFLAGGSKLGLRHG